ncbi:MAG: ABC transporter permease, partial [Planctomycetes bacterium]|nr:ABC transporter permease [Planctomycetota bacterium]
ALRPAKAGHYEPGVSPMKTSLLSRSLYALSGPLIGLAGVLICFTILVSINGELGSFLSAGNLRVLVHEGTIPAIIALGMLLIIITGGIDLSVGAVVALVTVVTMRVYAHLYASMGSSPVTNFVAVLAGIGVGGLCGFINGQVVTRLKLPSFVVTLGMLSIARGTAIWLANRSPIAFPVGARPEWVDVLSLSTLYNPGFFAMIVLAVVVAMMLRSTVLGRHIFAVGSNEATARLCGINVDRTKVTVYTLAGLLTGCAGIVMFAHGDSGNPSSGEGLELIVIAAVVIGGASLTGGRGTVIGTLIGVLVLGLLENGVNLCNVPV